MATLTQQEAAALQEFKRRLLQRFPREIQQVILFGSKARGDARPDSDTDVLVVAIHDNPAFRHAVHALCVDILLEHDVLLSVIVLGQQHRDELTAWGAPFLKHVMQDGTPV